MKVIPVALQEHYDSGGTNLAYAIFIERTDGTLFGFTGSDSSFRMDLTPWGYDTETSFLFDASQGLDVSTIVTTAGFSVDNLELTTLDDGSLFDRDDIFAGKWRDSKFIIFRYRWDVPTPTIADDLEVLVKGTFGEITLNDDTIVLELRGITQRLQQPVGIVSHQTCRARYGEQGLGKCNYDTTAEVFPLTVTGVTDKRTFTCSAAVQADDYFGEGLVEWDTGDNAGVSQKVRSFTAGQFVLSLPMVLSIQVGDTLFATRGCRKRLSDCVARANAVNFQGEPHRPTLDVLTRPV